MCCSILLYTLYLPAEVLIQMVDMAMLHTFLLQRWTKKVTRQQEEMEGCSRPVFVHFITVSTEYCFQREDDRRNYS